MERDEERPEAEAEEGGGPEKPAQGEGGPEEPAQGEGGREEPVQGEGGPEEPAQEEGGREEPAQVQAAETTAETEAPAEELAVPAEGPRRGERQPYVLMVGVSVAAVILGVVLFVAGFLTHTLLDDDVDLDPVQKDLAALTQRVGEIQGVLGIGGGDAASPTPAPVVAASVDDDPFVGPEDAAVTIIEFSDYQ